MKKWIIISLCLIMLSGCGLLGNRTKKDLNEAQQRAVVVNAELDEKNRQLTTGIVDLSELKKAAPVEDKLSIDELIEIFAKESQRIIGLPIERMDVVVLLQKYKTENEQLMVELQKERDQTTEWMKERRYLNDSISVLTERLEKSENRSIFDFIGSWFSKLSWSAIFLIIIGLIFAPTITIPLLGKIFSWIISFVPQVISFFGVVGKQAFDEVVTGIQNARQQVKNDPEDKRYTKKEVQELFDKQLSISTAESTKKVISHRKSALKLK